MDARVPISDRPSPSPVADLVLVAALLGVLMGVAWGVIWVQNASTAEVPPSLWLGAIPPATSAICGGVLLGVRRAYAGLPRLCRFLTRAAWLGLGGAIVLSVYLAGAAL